MLNAKSPKDLPKKKTKRDRYKYPGLMKDATSRIRREYLDQDYINKLSHEEKEWLSNFNEEWLGAKFNHQGEVLHKDKKEKREIYNRNNARNRCILSVAKARNQLVESEDLKSILENEENRRNVNPDNIEDALIEFIDSKKKE